MRRQAPKSERFVVLLVLFVATSWAGCDRGPQSSKQDEASGLQTAWTYEYAYEEDAPRVEPKTYAGDGEKHALFAAGGRVVSASASDGTVKWRTKLDPFLELQCQEFTLSEGRAFCSHLEKAVAWDLGSGRKLWQFQPSKERFFGLGIYDGSSRHFYGSGSNGHIYAIRKENGKPEHIWTFEFGAFAITHSAGSLYFSQAWTPEGAEGQSQGGIMKVDAATGDSLWNFRTERGGVYRMRPIVRDGVVYAGTRGGEKTAFYALDAETGEVIWENRGVRVYAAEWAGGTIVVNDGRDLMGIDAENGQTIWRTDMPGAHGERGIAYHDGYVYHPHAGPLAVVDVETGEVVHIEPPIRGSYYWVVGAGADKVFAQTSGALVAFEPYSAQ